jgi:multiple sugar transport system permease protein/sn-glycerol 3-phosphate transport system permease protein
MRWAEALGSRLAVVATLLLALMILFPFGLGVVGALLAPEALARGDLFPWPLFPENFVRAFQVVPMATYLWNSLVIAVIATIGAMTTSVLAAYALARMEFRGRGIAFIAVVATLAIPDLIGVVPNYLFLAKLDLVPGITAAVLPHLASGFTTFFLRQHFMAAPKSYDEAARLDGAGTLRILVDVHVPLAMPAIASMALFAFITEWNAYLWPLIVLSGDSQTVQIGLANLQASIREQPFTDWPLILAAAVIVLVPSFLMFFVAERQLVKGAGIGGIK